LYSVVTQLQAFSTVPDIILLTPGVTSQMGFAANWGTDLADESRENIGVYWRGFCQRNNIGYIDIGRHVRMLRDGLDIVAEDPRTITTPDLAGALTLPITLPTCRDFAVNWNMPFANAALIATGSSLRIKIGDTCNPGFPTYFDIGRTVGGNFAVTLNQLGVGIVFGPIDTGVAVPVSGTIWFEFLIRDTSVRLAAANADPVWVGVMPSIWEGEIERMRGPFTPTISFSNFGTTTITVTQVDLSVEQQVMPNMTDADLFGSVLPTVHPSTSGQVQLYRQALEQERFA
jgi:hypothetical protein